MITENNLNNKRTLLVIIGGGINKSYNSYKGRIINKFKARQIKPYVLEFPRELTKEEINDANQWLQKVNTRYEWLVTINDSNKK